MIGEFRAVEQLLVGSSIGGSIVGGKGAEGSGICRPGFNPKFEIRYLSFNSWKSYLFSLRLFTDVMDGNCLICRLKKIN